ncbi:hypothetical protein BGZ63DRAFT_349374 [Mariannaea sp. PMI_226]|nr:hypothetical protein BGZ63DRAFT_349374 [Mariannaea sp. PMI_226]
MAKRARKHISTGEDQPVPAASSSQSAPTGSASTVPGAGAGADAGVSSSSGSGSLSTASPKKTSKPPKPLEQLQQVVNAQQALVICRNKHWRYISCFHGPWPHMPIDVLEHMASINYNTPRPRPIDPAVLFDLAKVRRLVDEATNLAVRAASDISSPILTSVNGGLPGYQSMPPPSIGGAHGKLSKERRYRMREQASQKLGRAYRLDEIACSVATMQGASTLDDIGSIVLDRNPQDMDAKYIHFFHEKIPSRQVAESTSLRPLNEIISERPTEGEVLRTRAMVKTLMKDYEGATYDLTLALQIYRTHQRRHDPVEEEPQLQDMSQARRRNQDIILTGDDQPSSLEAQLLFQRATAYLSWSCQYIPVAVPSDVEESNQTTEPGYLGGLSNNDSIGVTRDGETAEQNMGLQQPQPSQAEARKLVKTYAKRALRDYILFLSRFEYAPEVPVRVAEDFNERINYAAHGQKKPRSAEPVPESESYPVYSLSDLFAAVPPSNIPAYPSPATSDSKAPCSHITYECMTYHPLLTEALHSLLLCHCLTQTSSKELLRHANMVARLTRLIDGYPIFQASRSPARSDWIEVIRRMENWLQLTDSWENLCASAPLPLFAGYTDHEKSSAQRAASAASTLINSASSSGGKVSDRDQVIVGALYDGASKGRVNPPKASGQVGENGPARPSHHFVAPTKQLPQKRGPVMSADGKVHSQTVRWSIDEAEYPFISERAVTITKWIREAPVVKGTGKRKKRVKKPHRSIELDEAMEQLDLEKPTAPTESG